MRRYPFLPDDGDAMTLDDLASFVAEMIGHRQLPGDTQVRAAGRIEFDMDGPRISRLTACPADPAPQETKTP